MSASYTPLWVKSHFSFLEGASAPGELVEAAAAAGLNAIALTDRDGMYGLVRAWVKAKEITAAGGSIRVIPGAQVSVLLEGAPSPRPRNARSTADPVDPKESLAPVIVLARSRDGYGRLCRLLSRGRLACEKGRSRVTVRDVQSAGSDLLFLSPYPDLLRPLKEAYDEGIYALIARHRTEMCIDRENVLREEAARLSIPTVAATEVLYHHPSRRDLQDVLTCLRQGVTLSTAGRWLRPNAEHAIKSPTAMAHLFEDDPESLLRTQEIAEACTFDLRDLRYRYPIEKVPRGETETSWLRRITEQGAHKRFPDGIPPSIRTQIDRELELIRDLQYEGYFVTMWEIVEYCRREQILCQGRGSAANSVVCYCLGVTAVDPGRVDLLFERFLSRERAEPPDIDLDIEHNRREEVIQWVYERYGRRYAAMVANIIRYRPKSAVRDVGKVLGLRAASVERLTRLLSHYEDQIDPRRFEDAGLEASSDTIKHLSRLTQEILEVPRHLSIHPGGFLLGHEPVDTLVPIEPGSMQGRTVVQWDKYDVEDLGLFKVDLLGLGALTVVRRAGELLKQHRDMNFDLAAIPEGDSETYAMMSRGDTVGVFQIESRAQMAMLPRLKPKEFYDLVIQIAIVRPGPIQGNMVHPYLRRRAGEEENHWPHKQSEHVLSKTYGVPIFQEQVMKLAMMVADYTAGEADQLRRDMAAWKSSGRIEAHHERIVERMVHNGVDREFAERMFSQIRGFGEYGFPESHAASFALIAYVTAWLRRHHPAVFLCAMLDAQPMGFYSAATLIEDAKRRGVEVRPIAVGKSDWDCGLESTAKRDELAVRVGLRYVQGLGIREREAFARATPPYADIEDFARRTGLGKKSLIALAEAGALEPFGIKRRDALWQLREFATRAEDTLDVPPRISAYFRALSRDEEIAWDYRTSHHSTRGHPMEKVRPDLRESGIPDARGVARMKDGRRTDYVGLVLCRQRPQTASGVVFATLEDETGFVNLVMWRDVFAEHEVIARTLHVLGVTGRVQSQDGVVHLVAESLWDPSLSKFVAPRASRDFH